MSIPVSSECDAQRHHNFLERGVAGALAEAVDGGIDVRGPGQHRRHGVGGGHAEVVVGMHLDVEIDRTAQLRDVPVSRERIEQAEGIGETEALGAGDLRGLGRLVQEIGVGARGIFRTTHLEAEIRARGTICVIWFSTQARSRRSLCLMCKSDTGIERFTIWARHSAAASRSVIRIRPQTMSRAGRCCMAMAWMVSRSSPPMAGTPTSISRTPTSARARAMETFSSTVNDTPAVCSPSRSVVSLMITALSSICGPVESPRLSRLLQSTCQMEQAVLSR